MNAFASILIGLLSVIMSAAASGGAGCGPFGDPPAEMNHSWFASFVSRHTPVCYGGEVLGPWTDAGGDERYACLYEPADTSEENPLPLVIFLHGSIATADSVRFTGLVELIDKADLGGKSRASSCSRRRAVTHRTIILGPIRTHSDGTTGTGS